MAQWIYQVGIQLMKLFLGLHQYFNEKSALAVAGRKNLFPALETALQNNDKPLIWFHAASLGEFEQGRPLMEHFKKHHPEYFILLSFFSPSGYEVRKNYEHANYVCYMPLDTAANAHKFIALTNPKMAFFIKYEFWHFHLQALAENGSWVFSISSIFRSKQAFFKWYGGFNRKMLYQIDHFFVQNSLSSALLRGINLNNISIVGDTRFDRVATIVAKAQEIPGMQQFTADHKVLVGGSTWEPDVACFAPFLRANKGWKAIVAPHDISETSLKMHEQVLGVPSQRWSAYQKQADDSVQVIIIDNIGMLTSLYQYGTIAFIGGAFGAGLHNTLEAACFGLPLYFGDKKYAKFQEAKDLLSIGAAESVATAAAFSTAVEDKVKQNKIATTGERSLQYIQKNIGATKKIMTHIDLILKEIADER
jgi:3-deoxy-D-manno-octulosonic-acid transferase